MDSSCAKHCSGDDSTKAMAVAYRSDNEVDVDVAVVSPPKADNLSLPDWSVLSLLLLLMVGVVCVSNDKILYCVSYSDDDYFSSFGTVVIVGAAFGDCQYSTVEGGQQQDTSRYYWRIFLLGDFNISTLLRLYAFRTSVVELL
jgi:hypothetical protein